MSATNCPMATTPTPPGAGTVAPGSDEARYQESEHRAMARWLAMTPETREERQKDPNSIPSWLNAPDWAQWIYFCKSRGWLFLSERPHVYGDGHVSGHVEHMTRACEVPGVMFFRNDKKYLGAQTPHWVCDRRRALAAAVQVPGDGSRPKPHRP